MDRNIGDAGVAGGPGAPAAGGRPQDYLDRLYKIIPAEMTAAYLAISTLLTDTTNPEAHATTLLIFAVFLMLLTPLYLWRLAGVRNMAQILVSTVSFPIWAAAISTSLLTLMFDFITPEIITVVMVGWVLVTPLLVKP